MNKLRAIGAAVALSFGVAVAAPAFAVDGAGLGQWVDQRAFSPQDGATVNLSAGTTTGNVQVQTTAFNRHVRIHNAGSVIAFCRRGTDNTITATTTAGFPVAPGSVEIIAFPGFTYMACITASGTATVYFTPGEGM